MKILNQLRLHLGRLLARPGQEIGVWGRFVLYQARLWRHCGRTLRRNNAAAMSAALSFRTIFALIPALVLALLMAKSIGALEGYKRSLRQSLGASGLRNIRLGGVPRDGAEAPGAEATTLPASAPAGESQPVEADSVADWIERLAADVETQLTIQRLGPIGLVLFIWTALTLLVTMEQSLNRVFGAARSRSTARRVLLYWSVLTLGPVVLSAAVYAAGAAAELMATTPALSWLLGAASWGGPPVVGVVLLAALYKLMPNTKVRFASAAGGALIAVVLWLAAKWAFMLYVTRLGGSLYGALGLLPLFLIWVNISWWIFLFGAQIAHTAANLQQLQAAERAEGAVLTAWDVLSAGLAVTDRYRTGAGPAPVAQVADDLRLTERATRQLLDRLTDRGVLAAVDARDGPAYLPARPLERIEVLELLDMGVAAGAGSAPGPRAAAMRAVLDEVRRRTQRALKDLTLADVMAGQDATKQGEKGDS